jgi:hypothetical protein
MAPVKTSAVEDLAALVARMPDLDKQGKVHGPPWAEAEQVLAELLAGGKDAVAKLVALLPEHDQGENYKVRYLLHSAVTYAARPGKEKERGIVVEGLLSALGGQAFRPDSGQASRTAQGIAIRELHKIAGKEAAEGLGKVLLDEALGEDAAQALLAIREGALEQFRRALPQAKGKALVSVLQALGVLRDAESVEGFRKATASEDPATRLTGLWALANVGDPGSVELLLKAAGAQEPHPRQRAVSFCLLLAERLAAAGRKDDARKIYAHLRDSRTEESERYVRDAAQAGLEALR